jgi:hypothetical protein
MPEWFRRPSWAEDWEAWKGAANEVAALNGERLPWPYNPEPLTTDKTFAAKCGFQYQDESDFFRGA